MYRWRIMSILQPAPLTSSLEIPVPANSDLEYMLDMKRGYSVSYEWRSTDISDPELLLAEFHGHTVRDSEEPGSVQARPCRDGSQAHS